MAGPLRVDYDALERLAHQLTELQLKLEGLGRDVGAFDRAVGAFEVNQRLSDLVGNWTKARLRIAGELKDLAAITSEAANIRIIC
ncbi:MAG TPA: hypothetical protein VFE55_07400 [Acidimicrobiia bacterium]|nr:hypothetical protein [Acidimicrobiia bacterium]